MNAAGELEIFFQLPFAFVVQKVQPACSSMESEHRVALLYFRRQVVKADPGMLRQNCRYLVIPFVHGGLLRQTTLMRLWRL